MSKQKDIASLRSMIARIESSDSFRTEAGQYSGPSFSEEAQKDGADVNLYNLNPVHFGECVSEKSNEAEEAKAGNKKASAFERIVKMTERRFRSERDIRFRLANEHYSQEEIDESVDRAIACLLIDDLRFADVLIRSRIRAGKGKQGIEAELRRESVDPESLDGWPYDYFPDDSESELDRAVSFLSQHPSRSKNPRQSAYRKLVQKGYSSSVASSASRIWCEGL